VFSCSHSEKVTDDNKIIQVCTKNEEATPTDVNAITTLHRRSLSAPPGLQHGIDIGASSENEDMYLEDLRLLEMGEGLANQPLIISTTDSGGDSNNIVYNDSKKDAIGLSESGVETAFMGSVTLGSEDTASESMSIGPDGVMTYSFEFFTYADRRLSRYVEKLVQSVNHRSLSEDG
jgi:hypothetical protein